MTNLAAIRELRSLFTQIPATIRYHPSCIILEIDAAPKFAFLALPPPPKKKRATVSNSFCAPMSAVHPGSSPPMTPASGISLPRSASFVSSPHLQGFRRPSLTHVGSRHLSVSSTRSRIPSVSFLHIADTPEPPFILSLRHPSPMMSISILLLLDTRRFSSTCLSLLQSPQRSTRR